MAGRSSASVATVVTIVVLIVLWFATFVFAVIFYGEMTSATRDLKVAQQDVLEFVREDERSRDDIVRLADRAREERQSVVGYLLAGQREVMDAVTGNARDDLVAFKTKASEATGGSTAPLIRVIADKDRQIETLGREVDSAEQASAAAREDLDSERRKLQAIAADYDRELQSMKTLVDQYASDVESYRSGTSDVRSDMEGRVERIRADASEREARMQEQLQQLTNDNLRLKDTLARLQQEKGQDRLKPRDEYALVDAQVIGLSPDQSEVYLSRGRSDNIVLGMTFSLYSDPTVIKPDANGVYPRGKAALEVISVQQDSSTCRVLSHTQGNPIVKGDVAANPVYDPNKVYTFLVYGNFDVDGDGRHTPLEATDLSAQIKQWGGTVVDELTGDVDFFVMGERPVLPPKPGLDTPPEILNEYIRLERIVRRYDDLFDTAAATSIPILNQNRLYTLLGR